MIDQTVSHYQILEKLGEGGMGVVYKAQDTKLDRFVALKFLPSSAPSSGTDSSRFLQEAKAAAALNHPNICTIHGIEEADGKQFIVMEFVDGQLLLERKSSLSVKQAVDIGIQIADGLAAAHEKGIVHRDIKPDNIMIRKDNIVQIMDFGLAKLRGVSRLTKEGSTVGTAGYMSPEQLQGQETDHRSDIFSFGVLLFKMFTGQLPFKGMHEAAVSYEIVNVDSPPMSSVKPGIPPELDAIVLECLARDPDERFQSAKEIAKELRRFKRESSRERVSRVSQVRPAQDESSDAPRQRKRLPISWIVATLLCAASALAIAFFHFSEREQPRQVLRYSIFAPENTDFGNTLTNTFSISPDGKLLVAEIRDSLGRSMLWIRRLEAFTFQPLRGTEGALLPFWSPDSRFIGFFADGAMRKIEPGGGPAITICNASTTAGTWNADGVIVFSQGLSSPLYRVEARGGIPTIITSLDSTRHETSHRLPQFLPDGKHFLFYSMIGSEEDAVMVGSLDGKAPQRLVSGSSFATYANGSLVYLREHTLMAQPFDAGSRILTGDPVPIAENVNSSPYVTGSAQFSTSANGVLLFQAGADRQIIQLNWYDRAGRKIGSIGEAAGYGSARIAPDGQRIAVSISDPKSRNEDIWLFDLRRGIRTRFTTDPSRDWLPVWSPDGRSIAFVTDRNKGTDIYVKESDGITAEHPLLQTPADERPTDWSRDGKYILYQSNGNPGTGQDMWVLPLSGDNKPYPFLKTEFSEGGGRFSPNVHWIAYSSNESGKSEVYVMPFPGPGVRISISNSGGNYPRWRGDGKEIFYLDPAKNVMAVQVREKGKTLEVLGAQVLFQVQPGASTESVYDVTSDGQRFLVISLPSARTVSSISVVVNWNEGLKAK